MMCQSRIRFVALLLIPCLLSESLLAVSSASAPIAITASCRSIFKQNALLARVVGMVTFGKREYPKGHQQVHQLLTQIGAETGGDLRLMSRLLRRIQTLHSKVLPPDRKISSHTDLIFQLHDVINYFRHPRQAFEADYVRTVRRQAEQLLRAAQIPRPIRSVPIQIRVLDLPNDASGQRFVKRFIHPKAGVRALHYKSPHGPAHVIVMRYEDFTVKRLAHELGEIGLLQRHPEMSWIEAHNHIVAAGLGGEFIKTPLLPVTGNFRQRDTAVKAAAMPVFVQAVQRLFDVRGLYGPDHLGVDLYSWMDDYQARVRERDRALNAISAEDLKREGKDITRLSSDQLNEELHVRWEQTARHLPSDAEIFQEILRPLLAKYSISASVQQLIFPHLVELVNQQIRLERTLELAEGLPIENLIRRLRYLTHITPAQAEAIAVAFARKLGWSNARIAKALAGQTLASSQNLIGAWVGDGRRAEDFARPDWPETLVGILHYGSPLEAGIQHVRYLEAAGYNALAAQLANHMVQLIKLMRIAKDQSKVDDDAWKKMGKNWYPYARDLHREIDIHMQTRLQAWTIRLAGKARQAPRPNIRRFFPSNGTQPAAARPRPIRLDFHIDDHGIWNDRQRMHTAQVDDMSLQSVMRGLKRYMNTLGWVSSNWGLWVNGVPVEEINKDQIQILQDDVIEVRFHPLMPHSGVRKVHLGDLKGEIPVGYEINPGEDLLQALMREWEKGHLVVGFELEDVHKLLKTIDIQYVLHEVNPVAVMVDEEIFSTGGSLAVRLLPGTQQSVYTLEIKPEYKMVQQLVWENHDLHAIRRNGHRGIAMLALPMLSLGSWAPWADAFSLITLLGIGIYGLIRWMSARADRPPFRSLLQAA